MTPPRTIKELRKRLPGWAIEYRDAGWNVDNSRSIWMRPGLCAYDRKSFPFIRLKDKGKAFDLFALALAIAEAAEARK